MKIEPDNRELWTRFQACERNEMIITKSGRCLFPVMKFNVIPEECDNLDPKSNSIFSYALGMERVDSFKWKYREGNWYPLPTASTHSSRVNESSWHLYEPETSPSSWPQIMQEGLNFSKVKLTNRKGSLSHNSMNAVNSNHATSSNFFSLSSFGNYVPVVYLLDWSRIFRNHLGISAPINISTILRNFDQSELELEKSLFKIRIHECSFIAVTHYQNVLITHLKKHNNPHAKGFILTDEGMGRMNPLIARGKPGRKRRISAPEQIADPQVDYHTLSYDVIMASLALEKMSSGSVPRSEIVTSTSPNSEHSIDYDLGNEKKNYKFLSYYNK